MPQLDKFMFFNQYLWFTIFFVVLYCLFLFMVLPLVLKILKFSKNKLLSLSNDLFSYQQSLSKFQLNIISFNKFNLDFLKFKFNLLNNFYLIQFLSKKI